LHKSAYFLHIAAADFIGLLARSPRRTARTRTIPRNRSSPSITHIGHPAARWYGRRRSGRGLWGSAV